MQNIVTNISLKSPQLNPAQSPEKSRFDSNRKNQQSQEASDYILGSSPPLGSPKSRTQGIRPDPSSKVGVSYEAPDFFFGSNTIIATKSYNNPHMNNADKREARYKNQDIRAKNFSCIKDGDDIAGRTIHNYQTYNIKDNWKDHSDNQNGIFNVRKAKHHKSYNCLTHQNSLVKTPDLKLQEKAQYNDGYYKVLEKQGSFRRQKEYFLDFVEQNDTMHVYGHINQKERPRQSFQQIKVYHLSEEEQKRKDKIKNSMKKFISNLSSRMKGGKSKILEESRSKGDSVMSLGSKLVNMFSNAAQDKPKDGEESSSGNNSVEFQYTDRMDQVQEDTGAQRMGGFKFLKRSPTMVNGEIRQKSTSSRFFKLGSPLNKSSDGMSQTQSTFSVRNKTNSQRMNTQVNQSQQGTLYGTFSSQQDSGNQSPFQSTYIKRQNSSEDYNEIPLVNTSKNQQKKLPGFNRKEQKTHLHDVKSKTYSNFYPKLGGVSKLPKDRPMKCLRGPKYDKYNGDLYLNSDSQYRKDFKKKMEKEILTETLSHQIFKTPLVYQNRKKQPEPTRDPLKIRNVEQIIDSFERTLDLHNQANSGYSQGFIWFDKMAKESNLKKE